MVTGGDLRGGVETTASDVSGLLEFRQLTVGSVTGHLADSRHHHHAPQLQPSGAVECGDAGLVRHDSRRSIRESVSNLGGIFIKAWSNRLPLSVTNLESASTLSAYAVLLWIFLNSTLSRDRWPNRISGL